MISSIIVFQNSAITLLIIISGLEIWKRYEGQIRKSVPTLDTCVAGTRQGQDAAVTLAFWLIKQNLEINNKVSASLSCSAE